MTTQEENELLCEKLLGWQRNCVGKWYRGCRGRGVRTPDFLTGDGMLSLLEAMDAAGLKVGLGTKAVDNGCWCEAYDLGRSLNIIHLRKTLPAAVRATALEYVASLS